MKSLICLQMMVLGVVATAVAGCSSMPAFGPDAEAIQGASQENAAQTADPLPFQLVEVTAATLPASSASFASFPAAFRAQGFRGADEVIEAGDQLDIRIWEVAEDGLFASAGNRETLLTVQVSNSGNIVVPYAGSIPAHGLTAAKLREVLLERYKGKAVSPEIAVEITATHAREVTILGDVRTPGRVEIGSRGVRLLDLIAQAGGTSDAPWEVMVHVQRDSITGSMSLASILDHAEGNIVAMPGETIHIDHQPRRFAVYGGVSRPANIEIPVEDAHLAYLLAEVGGLNDRVAQIRSVFVFRPTADAGLATAYQFDFSRPDALLLASAFRLMPTDITYVASADAADFNRFVSILLSPLLRTARNAGSLGN